MDFDDDDLWTISITNERYYVNVQFVGIAVDLGVTGLKFYSLKDHKSISTKGSFKTVIFDVVVMGHTVKKPLQYGTIVASTKMYSNSATQSTSL